MMDFNRKPREKSKEETEFDAVNAEYTEKFGKPYVFDLAADFMTMEDAIADVRRRIKENKPQEEPEYKPDAIY